MLESIDKMKDGQKLLHDIVTLTNSKEFQAFVWYLQDQQIKIALLSCKTEGIHSGRLQGGANLLGDLVEKIAGSQAVLEKIRNREREKGR